MIGGDYRQTVDPGILAYCLVNYVNQPPTFYTHEFKLLADNLLSRLDMHQNEVTAGNCEVIYCCMYYPVWIRIYVAIHNTQVFILGLCS